MGRLLSTGLQQRLGVPVIVENRGGAATSIGTELAARAAPDGQNWLVTSDSFAVLPALIPGIGFDIRADFAPVTLIASAPNVIAVHPSRPWQGLGDILAAARGGGLTYASTGNGTTGHLAMTRLAASQRVTLGHAAYRSGGPALNDAVAGHVDMIIGSAALLAPMMAAGRLRPVVQLGETRLPALAQVPTSAEAGFADFQAVTWWGVLAPARTPAPLMERMGAEVAAVFREERTARLITETQQAQLRLDGPEPMRRFLDQQITTWGAVIREHRITAD
jgi:tripartite-type tricarboxylate transporter receptor subunit TctC